MAASNGSQSSPGHAALGNVLCITASGQPWPSEQTADKVHLIIINNFAIVINLAI
jgi:hypothetical protein